MTLAIRIACALFLITGSSASSAQSYPAKPVRVIVPLSAGSATDVMMRSMAAHMSPMLGAPLVVEAMPGAGGMVGTSAGAKAPPDGYTLLMGTSGAFSINPHLQKTLPYDPVKDFTAICRFGGASYVLAVNPALGVKSFPELLAKAKTIQLSFASSGIGSTTHLAQELFRSRVGISFLHVPYKGAAQAVSDTVAGHSELIFETPGPLLSNIKGGKLVALGIMSPRRAAALPDVPTFEELGYPGLNLRGWVGLVAPMGTPETVVNRVAQACQSALASPDVVAQAVQQGVEIDFASPAEFAAFIPSELKRWGQLIKMANVKPE